MPRCPTYVFSFPRTHRHTDHVKGMRFTRRPGETRMTQRNSTGPQRDLWGLPTAGTGREPAGAPTERSSAWPPDGSHSHLTCICTRVALFLKFPLECCTFGHVSRMGKSTAKTPRMCNYISSNCVPHSTFPHKPSLPQPSLAGNITVMSPQRYDGHRIIFSYFRKMSLACQSCPPVEGAQRKERDLQGRGQPRALITPGTKILHPEKRTSPQPGS